MRQLQVHYPELTSSGHRELYNSISTDHGGPNFARIYDALEAAAP